jgi:hypothetical protein
LFGDRVLFVERIVARKIDFRVGERRFVAFELALGLVERSLVGTRIDLGQHIARLDHLAFLKIDLHQAGRSAPDEPSRSPAG